MKPLLITSAALLAFATAGVAAQKDSTRTYTGDIMDSGCAWAGSHSA